MSAIKNNIKKAINAVTGNKLCKNKLPENNSIKKILVISLYFAGDLLFHTTVIEAISLLFPNSKIDIWVKSGSGDLLKNDQRINNIIIYDNIKTAAYRNNSKYNFKETVKFIKILRKTKYDLIIDLTGKYSTALISHFSKPGYSIGINYNYFGFCYDKFVFLNTASEKGHLIDKYLTVLKQGLNINDQEWNSLRKDIKTKPYIYPDESSVRKINEILFQKKIAPGNYITIHLTSGWDAKMLPIRTFAEVIKYLEENKYEYLFVGNSGDKEKLTEICKILNDESGSIYERFIELNLNESAELIHRSKLFIGSDSAPLHIAGAFEIPSIGLFGPTNPLFSNPVGENHKYIYHELFCSAAVDKQYCTRNGGFTCPLYECMNTIRADEIIELINNMYGIEKGALL